MIASLATFDPGWGVSRGTMATEKRSTVVLIWSYVCKRKTSFHNNCLSNEYLQVIAGLRLSTAGVFVVQSVLSFISAQLLYHLLSL